MERINRREVLAGTMAGSVVAATSAAAAESGRRAEPVRNQEGASILGPRNADRERGNPDILVPPKTDRGLVPNLRFSFADAHMNLQDGGWAREVTQRELPIATELAGVNMRLKPGGVRELHWHKQSEWAFMLAGTARITAVDDAGKNFIADVGGGDVWYFPAGIPHSIQGLGPQGCEFLLVFPDGMFSESSTFLLSELMARTPREILSQNLGLPLAALDDIPREQLFIFEAPLPGPIATDAVRSPAGEVPRSMVFKLMDQPPIRAAGGTVRIVDAGNFPIATDVAAALVELDPGGLRELHWHQNADEWQFYLSGQGRMTVFAAQNDARTFDFAAGDVGYVPRSMSHYIQNTGAEPLRFLEMFRANKFVDMALAQWLALTPPDLVSAHLGIPAAQLAGLPKDKRLVVR